MNTAAMNFQASVILGGFGIESIPGADWRDSVRKGEPVSYRHEISGGALVECEDGKKRIVRVETALFGKKRFSALGGLVAGWQARPSKGKAHAQCKTVERNGEVSFDGPSPVFTEDDPIVNARAELGLCHKAQIAKGKTLAFADVELRAKLHGPKTADGRPNPNAGQPVVGKDGTAFYEIRHQGGVSVVDRPQQAELADDEVAPVSGECASTRQAARQRGGASAPAPVETGDAGFLFEGAL